MAKKLIRSTQSRPRLAVFRSLKHIYAQVIDDDKHVTLLTVSSLDPELKKTLKSPGNVAAAKQVGTELARRALEKGITQVVFDRKNRAYHGRVQAVAEGARSGGLKI